MAPGSPSGSATSSTPNRSTPSSAPPAWIAGRQHRTRHPYTGAAPGGWAWTHLPGGVPDVDDTSGALIALAHLQCRDGVEQGSRWLLQLQNANGGWPTFCRGWGHLPFDKSSPDLTAHALRALHATNATDRRIQHACARGLAYLTSTQRPDGSWVPLWFGNQLHPEQINPVLGTARTLRALEITCGCAPAPPLAPALQGEAADACQGTPCTRSFLRSTGFQPVPFAPSPCTQGEGSGSGDRPRPGWGEGSFLRALHYLLTQQNPDGGWGAAESIPSTIEETALVVSALCGFPQITDAASAIQRGAEYLLSGIEHGMLDHPAPLGLYFASLWYSERLYPIIWTLEALGRAAKCSRARPTA